VQGRYDSRIRIGLRLDKMRRILHIDTQRLRGRIIMQLEEVFYIASGYARGKISKIVDKDGKERPLTVAERQLWARIAAYTAQIINSIANGLDERQIDKDLDKLEEMLNKTAAAVKNQTSSGGMEPPRKSEGT
jgi:hypothetical protein